MLRVAVVAALVLALAASAAAQFGRSPMPNVQGVWSPVVGKGAAYRMEGREKGEMEIAVVGKEMLAGAEGYWMEFYTPKTPDGPTVLKQLMITSGPQVGIKRMIFQQGDEPPIEMDMSMMMGMAGQKQEHKSDFRSDAERVGIETITTPAGTFECEHWRSKDRKTDLWVSLKVAPYGMVKMISEGTTTTLTKVINDARSRIVGTPQKLDMQEMMRKAQERP
jgi:hypothetical protein